MRLIVSEIVLALSPLCVFLQVLDEIIRIRDYFPITSIMCVFLQVLDEIFSSQRLFSHNVNYVYFFRCWMRLFVSEIMFA